MLQSNVQAGTGTRARVSSQPTAGKTGTAQEGADIWFVGYTPQYATAVWIGATTGRIPLRMPGSITGGNFPARIFGQYMNAVLDGSERVEFPDPDSTRGGRGLRLAGEPLPTSTTLEEETEPTTPTSGVTTTIPTSVPPTTPPTDPTPTTEPPPVTAPGDSPDPPPPDVGD